MPRKMICQDWEQRENGRAQPDGHTLHLTAEDHKIFASEYIGRMPHLRDHNNVRQAAEPKTVQVSEETYQRALKKLKRGGSWHAHGIWGNAVNHYGQ